MYVVIAMVVPYARGGLCNIILSMGGIRGRIFLVRGRVGYIREEGGNEVNVWN